uniref:Gustatory receptor n=1 Tax=Glossina austeni TaxID=7395 RepID=A0A1A9UV99_GLOAU
MCTYGYIKLIAIDYNSRKLLDKEWKIFAEKFFNMLQRKRTKKMLVCRAINKITEFSNESNQNRMKSLEMQFSKALRPLLIISEILICAPVALQNPYNQSNYCTFCRKCLQIVGGLIAYIAVAHGSYNEYFFLSAYLPTQELPFYLSEFAFYLLHVLLIMLASFFGRKTFTFSLTFILDFDSKLLKHFKIRMHYKDLRKFLRNHLSLNFAFFLSVVIVGCIQRRSSLLGILTISTSYTLPNVITQTSLIQYYGLVYVVNKRLQLLHQLIEQTLQESLKKNIFNVQRRLRVLRGLYADMDAYTKHLNDVFAVPLLLVFMASLKSLSFYIFTLYKWTDKWTDLSYAVTSYAIIEICWQFSRAFLILHFNQAIQNQRKQAAILFTSFSSVAERLEPTNVSLISDQSFYCAIVCGSSELYYLWNHTVKHECSYDASREKLKRTVFHANEKQILITLNHAKAIKVHCMTITSKMLTPKADQQVKKF